MVSASSSGISMSKASSMAMISSTASRMQSYPNTQLWRRPSTRSLGRGSTTASRHHCPKRMKVHLDLRLDSREAVGAEVLREGGARDHGVELDAQLLGDDALDLV